MLNQHITTLRTRGPLLAKQWRADGTIANYDSPRQYTFKRQVVGGIDHLYLLLQELQRDPRSCIIRGQPKAGTDPKAVVLRNLDTFEDEPSHLFMVDVDRFEGTVEEFVATLPAPLQDASFVWQLSGSHGHPSKGGGLRAHLWFWLETPLTSEQAEAWAKQWIPQADCTVHRTVQVNYTAAPVMDDGVSDPIAQRLGFVEGMLGHNVIIPADMPVPEGQTRRTRRAERASGMVDPRDKPGIIGALARAHPAAEIVTLWPDHFEAGSKEHRITWLAGGGAKEGVGVADNGTHLFNTHSTSPIADRAANLFDFVRAHVFGHLDEGIDQDVLDLDVTAAPSYLATVEWALSLPTVQAEVQAEQAAMAEMRETLAAGADAATRDYEDAPNAAGAAVYFASNLPAADPGAESAARCPAESTVATPADSSGVVGPAVAAEAEADADDGQEDEDERRVLVPGEHSVIASKLWRRKFGGPTAPGLIRWNCDWYRRSGDGSHFGEMPGEALAAACHRYLVSARKMTQPGPAGEPARLVPFNPNKQATDEVIYALRTLCHLDEQAAPVWIGGKAPTGYEGLRAADLVALRNGLFHLPTRRLFPHTPHRFGLAALPYEFDPTAQCPEWLKFVRSVWPNDDQTIGALQETLGYLVSGDTRQQKVFFLVGPRRSGKGTICRVINGLLGSDNVAGPTLQTLASQFGMASLIGRTAAIIGDARSGGANVQTTVERLLGISGGDVQTVERKNRTDWIGRLGVRFVICSNEVPKLPDASGALVGRMLVLRMEHSFFGKEDPALADRLVQELPGILNWALEGLQRVEQRGRFQQPDASAQVIEQMEALGSQVGEFLKDCCILGAGERMPKQPSYNAYRLWARDQGISHPDPLGTFARNLYAAGVGIREVRPNGAQRARAFAGMRLTDEWADRVDTAEL
ncbi:hypothetical protein HLB44_16850 [Aquincola sp. S2]|uniref:SF3 helicase domain-containing protein n=1 Tax=Pseudaquabacterium terrae TaxID=2732868 RepID=A0ABX2EJ76_9BURK|nr:DNA primase family protein [Aquabacterium terrae]NRF68663.1 hypothetical protein [Aquabacterium terrae]